MNDLTEINKLNKKKEVLTWKTQKLRKLIVLTPMQRNA